MNDTTTIAIRAKCNHCGGSATNFLPWPTHDNEMMINRQITCPVCFKKFKAWINNIEEIYKPIK
jgi:hypothetical protein